MPPLADQHTQERSVAETIEHTLAIQILRGEHAPGVRLASVRALAGEWDTTAPTIQRVIDRLAAMELVTVKRGSGVTVRDPRQASGLALFPLWFEAEADQPEACAKRLSDVLEIRRVVMVRMLTRRQTRLIAAAPALLTHVKQLSSLGDDVGPRAQADLALSAALVEVMDNMAVRSLFQTIRQLVLTVPWVAEAFYAEPGSHRQMVTGMAAALTRPGRDLAGRLEDVVETFDNATVQRFRTLLEEQCTPS